MPKLIQTTTTETETTWKGLANLIKGGGGTLKIGDIITEKTLDGEETLLIACTSPTTGTPATGTPATSFTSRSAS